MYTRGAVTSRRHVGGLCIVNEEWVKLQNMKIPMLRSLQTVYISNGVHV